MKILITAPSLETSKNVSGISTVVNTIIANNVDHEYTHYLLGRPDQSNSLTYLFVFIRQLMFFPIILKREKIELVHQNLPFDPKGLMRESVINFWCYLFNVPVVLHIHGGAFLMQKNPKKIWRFLSSALFKHSRQVLVLSELEQAALLSFHNFGGAIVLSNSIAVSDYLYNLRQPINEPPVFLFLGRLHESKGLDDIYDAFCVLKQQLLSFRFVLCGSGPLMESVKSKFEKLLGSDFDFRGVVSGEDKVAAFIDSDFFFATLTLWRRFADGFA
ncbi:glycosyltransferase [Sphingobacterium populi]|uniref:glycosyltransferase n=1 Tax=Sphingobacterium sp. CFCC 11742 TaxID=1775560 RepID=UPI000829BBA4|nr:glycosyltransferase [Sphingobacterium sp. CFCC 11742]